MPDFNTAGRVYSHPTATKEFSTFVPNHITISNAPQVTQSQPLPEGEIIAENIRAILAKKMLLPTFDVPEDCRGGRWLIVPMDNERYGFG